LGSQRARTKTHPSRENAPMVILLRAQTTYMIVPTGGVMASTRNRTPRRAWPAFRPGSRYTAVKPPSTTKTLPAQ